MELGIHLADQTVHFLQAILLGAAFGLLYDAFRITRLALPSPRGVVFAEDVIFFTALAVFSFFFLMSTLDGRVRMFLFVGMGLGALLYSLTLSLLVMGVSRVIIGIVKAVLRFILRWFLQPVYRMVYWICRQLLRPLRFCGRFLKKTCQRCKYRLKVHYKMLYNQLRSMLARKDVKKRKSAHEPQENES